MFGQNISHRDAPGGPQSRDQDSPTAHILYKMCAPIIAPSQSISILITCPHALMNALLPATTPAPHGLDHTYSAGLNLYLAIERLVYPNPPLPFLSSMAAETYGPP